MAGNKATFLVISSTVIYKLQCPCCSVDPKTMALSAMPAREEIGVRLQRICTLSYGLHLFFSNGTPG